VPTVDAASQIVTLSTSMTLRQARFHRHYHMQNTTVGSWVFVTRRMLTIGHGLRASAAKFRIGINLCSSLKL
jgi:hypothetical protein